jgi:predicted lipase
MHLYNYGSPRVGNIEFARFFKDHIPDAWRVTSGGDLITNKPN